MKGVNEHIENFNSEPCGRHFGHLLFSKERETGDQFGRTIQPKYGSVYLHPNMVKKKSLTLKLRFFLVYTEYTRGSMILPPRQPRLLARLPRWQLAQVYALYVM